MFWTIILALIVVFYVFPLVLALVMAILEGLFEVGKALGWAVLIIIGIVLFCIIL